MPQIKVPSKQRRVLFQDSERTSRLFRNVKHTALTMVEDEDSASPSSSSVSLEQESGTRFVEIEGEENESLSEANLRIPYRANINVVAKSAVPSIFTSLPQLQDHVSTESSILQDKTVEECLPFLSGTAEQGLNDCNAHGLPRLRRELHLQYLYDALESYPASYVGYDASRPWVLYWSLTGLSLLGENVESYAERYGHQSSTHLASY